MSIACVAVIGKASNPLYLKAVANTDDPLKFHYIAHTALDIVDEKVAPKKTQQDMYLGLLYPMEEYKVYGYITNSKIKLILVIDDTLAEVKEAELRSLFKAFHNAYIELVLNPFYVPDDKIDSKRFERRISALIASLNKQ